MIKIITAMDNPKLNKELQNEKNIEIIGRDIQYKEGILELLENNLEINYIIINIDLPGEIEINKLIDKIIEKNKKIKIIITIKKEDKDKKIIYNKKIIKIYYEKNINLNKLKVYNNYENLYKKNISKNIENNEIKNNSKLILFFGERQVGKSLIIFNISNFLSNQNYKILIIELNIENTSFDKFFKLKIQNKIKYRKIIKKLYKIKYKKYKIKYINRKIINNFILKINKNIDLISFNKFITLNLLKYLEKNYNYIFVENYINKNNFLNKELIKNSQKNILIIRPNLLGIKNANKIIEKNKLNNNKINIKKLNIIINNYNKFSIDEDLIKNIFKKNKIIGTIQYNEKYEQLINCGFKQNECFLNTNSIETKKIISNII